MEAMREGQHEKQGHSGRSMLVTALSFVAMFILMYAMVERFANIYANFNQVYMAGPDGRAHGAHRDSTHLQHVSQRHAQWGMDAVSAEPDGSD